MQVRIRPGYDKQTDWQPDVRVIIDVFRASSTAVAILESKPTELVIANDFNYLKTLSDEGYIVVSEVFDLGIDNSPTLIRKLGAHGQKFALKTANLTTALEANDFDGDIYLCCINNLVAVSKFLRDSSLQKVEIIPAGFMSDNQMNFEDEHCAESLKRSLVSGQTPETDSLALTEFVEEKLKRKAHADHYREDLLSCIQINSSIVIPKIVKKSSGRFWLGAATK